MIRRRRKTVAGGAACRGNREADRAWRNAGRRKSCGQGILQGDGQGRRLLRQAADCDGKEGSRRSGCHQPVRPHRASRKSLAFSSKLDKAATQPQGATLTELHNLRSALAKEARGADASTREAAGKVVGTIDDLVHGSRPAINPNNLDVINLHKEASQKWRSAALADDIEWREGKAATKLAVSPGTSADTANRAAFKPVLDRANKPGAYNPYTDEQKALLAKIVFGDRGQNIARNVGRTADSPITRSHSCRSGRGAWLWAWGSVCSRWSCTRREQGPAGCWSASGCLGRAPGSEEYRCAAAQHQRAIERDPLAQRPRANNGRANSGALLLHLPMWTD